MNTLTFKLIWPPQGEPLYITVDVAKDLAWNPTTAQLMGERITEALVSRAKADKHK